MNASSPIAPDLSHPLLLREDHAGVARLTLNRPRQYNALSVELIAELQAAFAAIERDASIRVVIIAASGPAFCAGHDLRQMRATHDRDSYQRLFSTCATMMMAMTRLPQPVIASVQGIATAAGCQLVAQCDLAIASDSAKFAVSGINLGLFCSTPSVALGRNVPRKRAMEMLLTGDFIDAATARDLGLVNHVVGPDALDAAVQQLAQKLLAKSAVAIGIGKRLFYRQLEMGMEQAYQYAATEMAANMMTQDACDGIDAFVHKRGLPQKDR